MELELTAMLAQIDTLSSPQRRRETLAAHMKVLHSLSFRDPLFGPLLSHLHSSLSSLLQSTRVKEVSELLERNKDLNRYITEQKMVIKQEIEEKSAVERVYETLLKEKSLLGKKVEELTVHYKRTGERQGEKREHWDKKISELEETLRIARKREMRLLHLLDFVKSRKEPSSPHDSALIPPLDLLLSKDCSPFSSNNIGFGESSEDSTEEVKTGLSWEMPDDPACNQ